jgi:hypothetical protein
MATKLTRDQVLEMCTAHDAEAMAELWLNQAEWART